MPKDSDGKTQSPIGGQWIIAPQSGNGGTPMLKAVSSTFDYQGVQENIVSKRNMILQKAYVPIQTDPRWRLYWICNEYVFWLECC